MKNQHIFFALLFAFGLHCNMAMGREKTGQSFMYTRPIYRNVAAQRSLFMVFASCKQGPVKGIFQVMPMMMESLNADHWTEQSGRYFFINCKNTLNVKGFAAPNPQDRDVLAHWFGLSDNYDGTITINPKQKQSAIWFEYQQDAIYFSDCCWLKSLWVGVAVPIQHIKNDLRLTEHVITPSSTGAGNMVNAFVRPQLKYGKMGPMDGKFSATEIMIKLGTFFMNTDGYIVAFNNHFIIPTAGSQNPEFIFDPFLGNNGHFAWNSAVNFQIPLNDCTDRYVFAFFFEAENLMFIHSHEKRIVEIKHKPWSRYLLLNSTKGKMNVPAANVFTHNVKVRPFNFADFSGGWRFYNDSVEAEFGYSMWAHGKERLEPQKPCFIDEEWGIAGEGTYVDERGITVGHTASKSTIDFQAANDVDPVTGSTDFFVPIQAKDLTYIKAAARTTMLHRVHVAGGYRMTNCGGVEGFMGLGGFVEMPSRNTVLASWGLWVKGGLSF